MQSTTTPGVRVPLTPAHNDAASRAVRAAESSCREAARQALAAAQRNPIMSSDELFAVAQINALLAIEERLGEIVAELGKSR